MGKTGSWINSKYSLSTVHCAKGFISVIFMLKSPLKEMLLCQAHFTDEGTKTWEGLRSAGLVYEKLLMEDASEDCPVPTATLSFIQSHQ